MRFAPEGRPFILIGFAVLALLALVAWRFGGVWRALPVAWLPIAIWIPAFFRDPARPGPRGPDLVVAPADGKVVSIVEVHEPDISPDSLLRISVFMNVFNVHVNRYPVDGTVARVDYRPGRFFNATLDKASEQNERSTVVLETAFGRVGVRQIAGLVARRIVTDPTPGDGARQGERFGIIRFGSRVDTFLPRGYEPRVALGQKTVAGVTVIAGRADQTD